MKKYLILLAAVLAFVGCAKKSDVINLQNQINQLQLRAEDIAKLDIQVTYIIASIEDLEDMDEKLEKSIAEIDLEIAALEASDAEQLKQLSELKANLETQAKALNDRIDALKTYVDELNASTKDWTTATFSTLEQYEATCKTIAGIEQSIKDLKIDMAKAIEDAIAKSETSMKLWVNEQLTGYYTIAQMDTKLDALKKAQEESDEALAKQIEQAKQALEKAQKDGDEALAKEILQLKQDLEKAQKEGDEALAKEIAQLKSDLASAKIELTSAYEAAIKTAIETLEGKINTKIAADIKAASNVLQAQIDNLSSKVAAVESRLDKVEARLSEAEQSLKAIDSRLGKVEGSLEKILAMIQSIVAVPGYSDGSVAANQEGNSDIMFIVTPRKASEALAKQELTVFSMLGVQTQTKASMFTSIPVKAVKDNGEALVVTVDATGLGADFFAGTQSINACLKVDDGTNSLVTSYFGLTAVKAPKYVDLGLPSGTLWAKYNVGAEKPEDYGDFFAWGETTPKEDYVQYNWTYYKWCNGSQMRLTKYCNNSYYGNNGFTDTKTELDPEDDAATVNWGEEWRMPTGDQLKELKEECTWTWTTDYNSTGVAGHIVSSKASGNTNSIFIPASGDCYEQRGLVDRGKAAYLWSRTLADDPRSAYDVDFYDYGYTVSIFYSDSFRAFGYSVRAVLCQGEN